MIECRCRSSREVSKLLGIELFQSTTLKACTVLSVSIPFFIIHCMGNLSNYNNVELNWMKYVSYIDTYALAGLALAQTKIVV